jgi:hypothetical protein
MPSRTNDEQSIGVDPKIPKVVLAILTWIFNDILMDPDIEGLGGLGGSVSINEECGRGYTAF